MTSCAHRVTNPTKTLVTALALCSRLGGCPTQRMPGSVGLPRNPVPCEVSAAPRQPSARQHVKGAAIEGAEDVEVPMVQAGDHTRPVPLS